MANLNYFFAYASKPVVVGDTISSAASRMRTATRRVTPWQELEVAGHFIRNQVLNSVEQCDLFIADISRQNFNVTYEIGYAIGFGKPVLLVRNRTVDEGPHKLTDIGLFDTIGYVDYDNSDELKTAIENNATPLPLLATSNLNLAAPVYTIEPKHKSNYILRVRSRLALARVTARKFDPQETSRLSSWEAIDQVAQSYGVLVPLLSKTYSDHFFHNIRAAFIAGLAAGMGKPVTIVQDSLADPVPLDYRDLVRPCQSLDELRKPIADFVLDVMSAIQVTRPKDRETPKKLLTMLSLGANAAENEVSALAEYYLPVEAFNQSRRGEAHVVVGRKGSGKSALFFELSNTLNRQHDSVVISLKPETSQLLKLKESVLQKLSAGTREHTVMAFWEYVLLVEIGSHIIATDRDLYLRDHNLFLTYRELERQLSQMPVQIGSSFSDRVATLVKQVTSAFREKTRNSREQSVNDADMTDMIYRGSIVDLGNALFEYLKRKNSLWLLFDNIDKGWSAEGLDKIDLTLIRSLIEACRKVQNRLSRSNVKAHSILFLRNDVYELLVRNTADKGKEAAIKVDWTDPDLLRELLRLRFVSSGLFSRDATFDEIWEKIAATHYMGEETSQYLIDRCLMRPRFLIDLVSYCKSSACNLGHDKIEISDIDKGLQNYSNDVVSDLQYEVHDIDPQAEDVIYAFFGYPRHFGPHELERAVSASGVVPEKLDNVVEMLLWYGFLGIFHDGETPVYIYNVNYEMKVLNGIRKKLGPSAIYCINPAFEPALRMTD